MRSPTLTPTRIPAAPRTAAPAVRRPNALVRAMNAVFDWNDRYRSRRMLMEWDARALRDIGLTRADAEREADKPFWRV